MSHLDRFAREIETQNCLPERLALLMGGLLDPDLPVDRYLRQIDALSRQVAARLVPQSSGRARLEQLVAILGYEMGFAGNTEDYYDPANSFLHLVLERRRGLPITLSLLYMAVGRRLGIELQGMGFPGHFMLQFQDRTEVYALDAFHREIVSMEQVDRYLSQIFQQPVQVSSPFDEYQVDVRMLILRILNNLRAVYLSRHNFDQAVRVLDFMVVVAPDEAALWRERGLLHYWLDHLLTAESDLRRYFARRRQLHHFVESRPIQDLQPPIVAPPLPTEELTSETLEILAVIEQIRTEVARLN